MTEFAVLLVRRNDHFAFLQRVDGSWTFPSGEVEEDEMHAEAALRETREEAGLEATIQHCFGSCTIGENHLTYFLGAWLGNDLELKEPDKFQQVIWASPQQIIAIQGDRLFPPIRQYFDSIISPTHKLEMN